MQITPQVRGGNFRLLLPNNQELKTRPYTRPQLPENGQDIARHNKHRRSLFAYQEQNHYIQHTVYKQQKLHLHARMLGLDWKQFRVKAPKSLKTREIYEVDFNTNGFP